jgi:hypothetical protein
MSLDPIEAIEQVLDRIDEGCNYGNNWCTGGWLHNASKEEIIRFISVSIRARVQNALERTKEAFENNVNSAATRKCLEEVLDDYDDESPIANEIRDVLKIPPRNCDRFNTGDVKMDAQHAMEAILKEGVAGYRGIAEYLLSPVKEEESCTRATDATI